MPPLSIYLKELERMMQIVHASIKRITEES
jgi:hypothetical protein